MSDRATSPVVATGAAFLVLCGAWALLLGGPVASVSGPRTPEARAEAEISAALSAIEEAERSMKSQNYGVAELQARAARERLIAAKAHLRDAGP